MISNNNNLFFNYPSLSETHNKTLQSEMSNLQARCYQIEIQKNSLSDHLEQQENLLQQAGATIYLKIKNNRIY